MAGALDGEGSEVYRVFANREAPANARPITRETAVETPAPLAINLLGGFRVSVYGRIVPGSAWRQRRSAAVVKLLALAPTHRLHREQVIEALWPDLDGEAAANNFRVAVHRARRRLDEAGADPGGFLVRDGDEVVLSASNLVQIDVGLFESAVSRAWRTDDPVASREAVDLYAGDLLPEDLYEEWAASRRATLHASYLTLLGHLAQLHEQRDEPGPAIATWQRLLVAEPLDEPAHAALIRLFAEIGETRQATLQYGRLTTLLSDELGIEPDASTQQLLATIRDGQAAARAQAFTPAALQHDIAAPTTPPEARTGGLPIVGEEPVGREREVAEVKRLLKTHRLVTLTGPAGVGKTHLGIAVAHAVSGGRPDQSGFVDLAPLRDADLVLPAVGRALGVRDEGDRSILESIAARLGDNHALLMVDNFEHVATAAPSIADLLAACRGLHLLVTSRGRLRLRGEQEYPVRPLAVPDRPAEFDGAVVDAAPSDFPAVALFVRRLSEAQPSLETTAEDLEVIVEICRRLDGLPLAIELAAARMRVFSPGALLARLERPLDILTSGPRDAPPRQQTLRNAIAWSHDLLDTEEQALFACLAVFAGGFTLDAVEILAERSGARPRPAIDLIASLVEHNVVRRASDIAGAPRFAMLETIREYAAERLAMSGARVAVQTRHAAIFLSLAERAEPELAGADATVWLDRLDVEHANLRGALSTLLEHGDAIAALRLAGALWRFWWLHGFLAEGRSWFQRALAQGAAVPAHVRAKALDGAGSLAAAQGDLEQAAALHAEALTLSREAMDQGGTIRALTNLALVDDERGDPRQASSLLQEALVLARATADRRGIAVALANLGQVALTLGEHERAAAFFAESVALFRELGERRDEAAILANLGVLAFSLAEFADAERCHAEALNLLRGLGDRQGEADELFNLGHAVQQQGDLARAGALFAAALARFEQLGDRGGEAFARNHLGRLALLRGDTIAAEEFLRQGYTLGEEFGDQIAAVEALEGLAAAANARGDALRCGRLLGAAEARRETIGVPLPLVHRAELLRCAANARLALGDDTFAAAQAQGRALAMKPIDEAPLAQLAG